MLVQYGQIFLLTVFCVAYILYPSWAVPQLEVRSFLLGGMLLYSIGLFVLVRLSTRHLHTSNLGVLFEGKAFPAPLVGLLLLFCFLHLCFTFFPIAPIDDRLYHVYAPLRLFEYVLPVIKAKLDFDPWLVIQVLFFCVVLLTYRILKYSKALLNDTKKLGILLFSGFVFLAWMEYIMLSGHVLPEGLHRFPPLGKLFYLVSYLSFGLNEFAVQFWTIVFTLASGWMFYHLLKIRFPASAAWGGVAVLLAIPVVFFYGNSPELDCATLFFLVAAAYGYQKYRQDKNELFLFLVSVLLSVGFLYKRYVITLAMIMVIDMVLDMLKEKKFAFRPFFVLSIPVGAIAFPWLVFGKIYSIRNYQFSIENVINTIPEYWYLFVQEFSYPGAVIILASVVIGLGVQRNGFSRFMLFWLVGYLVFFSADFPYPVDRFSLLVMPPLVFFLVSTVAAVFSERKSQYILGGLALAFLGIATFFKAPGVSEKYHALDFARNLPRYDKTMEYMGTLPKSNFLDFGVPNGLYLLEHGLWPLIHNTTQTNNEKNIRLWWMEHQNQPLLDFIHSKDIGYVVWPTANYRHLYPAQFIPWVESEFDALKRAGKIVLLKEFGEGEANVQIYEVMKQDVKSGRL